MHKNSLINFKLLTGLKMLCYQISDSYFLREFYELSTLFFRKKNTEEILEDRNVVDGMQAVLEPASSSEHQSSNIQDECVLQLHI